MTTETDVKQRLAALYAVLAAATNPDGSARFEGFRQPCEQRWTNSLGGFPFHPNGCRRCNGTGWQVRAGGLAAGLAGLDAGGARNVLHDLKSVMSPRGLDPTPTEAEIDEAGLRLVCQVAGLEVPE